MIDTKALREKVINLAIQGKLTKQLPEDGNAIDLYEQIQEGKDKLIKEGKLKNCKRLPEISNDEILFEIPDNWKWVRLGMISNFKSGFAYKSNNYVKKSNNQVVRLGNIKQNKLILDSRPVYISDDQAARSHDYMIKDGDILVTMTGTRRRKDYFFSSYVASENLIGRNLFLNQRVGCIETLGGINPQYLVKAIQSSYVRNPIFLYETGTVNQGNIGAEDIKMHIVLPLPPLSEQKRIVEKVDSILLQLEIVDNLQRQYDFDSEILKQKIIDAGIRGKLTEQLPEEGNAEDLYAQIQEEKAKLIKEGNSMAISHGIIDFTDQIYLPFIMNLTAQKKYGFVLSLFSKWLMIC